MKPAIFLDRDNTLIENDGDLGDPSRVKLIKGAASAIASLRGLGFTIVVVSNQGGVARGRFEESDVDAVNKRLNEMIESTTRALVDRFYYCPYHPQGTVQQYRKEHPWRKPKPGMLIQAAKDMGLDLNRSWMIGDQLRDVQAGQGAGVRTILLRGNVEKATPGVEVQGGLSRSGTDEDQRVIPTYVAPSLAEAVKVVAQMPRPERAMDLTGASALPRARGGGPSSGQRPAGDGGETRVSGVSGVSGSAGVRSVDTRPQRVVVRQAVEVAVPSGEDGAGADEHRPAEKAGPKATEVRVSLGEVESVGEVEVVVPDSIVGGTIPRENLGQDRPLLTTKNDSPKATGSTDVPLGTVVRQILQELRNQRQPETDFSYVNVVAIVLQMIAVMCLLGAVFMGGGDLGQFVRWIMAAVVVQLGTIAALLFRK